MGQLAAGATYASGSWAWGLNQLGWTVPLKTYNQVAITKMGTTVTMYWNGSIAKTSLVTHAIPTSGQIITIGRADVSVYSGEWAFHGNIDDIRIYNRALSSSEVAQLYAIESSPPCSPHKATATATMVSGFVVGATITDPGCGYTNAPTVLIQGGGGSGATATATVSDGQVTAINVTSAGFGYTSVPKVVIGSPPFVPTVSIAVSKVKVTQNVVLGRTYVLEASADLIIWTPTGPPFTANSETIINEFDVDVTGRFFRIRQVP